MIAVVKDGDVVHITGSATGLLLNGELIESTRASERNADGSIMPFPKGKLN